MLGLSRLPQVMSMYWGKGQYCRCSCPGEYVRVDGSMLPVLIFMCSDDKCNLCSYQCVCVRGLVIVARVHVHVYVLGRGQCCLFSCQCVCIGVNVAFDHVNVDVFRGRGQCCLCACPCICVEGG